MTETKRSGTVCRLHMTDRDTPVRPDRKKKEFDRHAPPHSELYAKSCISTSKDWKGELQALIDENNSRHAKRSKSVSHDTEDKRANALFLMFRTLRSAGYAIGPSQLAGRHVAFLVWYWTADPRAAEALKNRSARLEPRKRPLAPATIQTRLSFLRSLATWTGKDGMILPAERYVTDPALVTRSEVATYDHGWAAAGVDAGQIILEVQAFDAVVGLQLMLACAFGLRVKEAVMFSPTLNEVPAHALPVSFGSTPYVAFLRVKRGTKGGRLRFVPIRNDLQRQALELAHAFVNSFGPRPLPHVGRPGMSLKQSLDRFAYVMRKFGLTRAGLGVTAHGVRHQFAGDLYFELAEVKPPVAGGATLDRATMDAVYCEVAHQLGHGRPHVSAAYLGSRRPVATQRGDSPMPSLPTPLNVDEDRANGA